MRFAALFSWSPRRLLVCNHRKPLACTQHHHRRDNSWRTAAYRRSQRATVGGGQLGYGSASMLLANAASDSSGQFSVSAAVDTCPQADTPIYITATGGITATGDGPGVGSSNPAIAMAAPAGTCSDAPSSSINIDEVTTVATALAYASSSLSSMERRRATSIGAPTTGSGTRVYPVGLLNAFSTANTLVDSTPEHAGQHPERRSRSGQDQSPGEHPGGVHQYQLAQLDWMRHALCRNHPRLRQRTHRHAAGGSLPRHPSQRGSGCALWIAGLQMRHFNLRSRQADRLDGGR